MGRSTPARSSTGRFRPLMIAAKLLMSLVTRAVATEKADMVTMSRPSRTARTARPPS